MALPAKKTTDSKDMSWSPDRRAAWSKRMKKEKANGTWHKKTMKEIGRNISKGKKASNKKKRLSIARKNGWETRRANGNCDTPKITSVEKDLNKLLFRMKEYLGYEITVEEFTEQAVKEKMGRIAMAFSTNKIY